ncbi:hypothetical protein PMAYCL1PPCAC_21851, partial [Pristionchus mayeri]
ALYCSTNHRLFTQMEHRQACDAPPAYSAIIPNQPIQHQPQSELPPVYTRFFEIPLNKKATPCYLNSSTHQQWW